jgi:hypothetical protein
MMVALSSSETSVLTRVTRRNIPEDAIQQWIYNIFTLILRPSNSECNFIRVNLVFIAIYNVSSVGIYSMCSHHCNRFTAFQRVCFRLVLTVA